MSIVTGLFLRFGRVIPAHQITPQLADELHSALAKVMMYAKANNVKLTSQQVRYIMEQTRQLDIYEGKGVEQVVKGPKADVIDLSKRLGPDAPYSAQNPEGWMPKEGEFKNTFNEKLVEDTINLFKSKTDNRSYQDELKKLMLRKGTYADYSADEIEAILKGIKTEPDPSGLMNGGRVKYANGSDPKSYDVPTELPLKISGNFSKSKDSEILDYVASLEIPVSEKIKLIGELTGVNSSFEDEYGKYKYHDLMKSVGLNYNEGGEGLSAALKHNLDTGENNAYVQYKMPFAMGGRIGYSTGAGKKGVQGILDLVKDKFGKKSITTADKVARPESATTREMFKAFNERMKSKKGTYGSGESLYKILKSEGITIDKAVKEALADMPRLSGDAKYDADAVSDVVFEKLDIDPDTLDQHHVLDVYDKAYNLLTKNKKLTPKESFLKQYFAKKQKEKQEMYKDMYEKAAEDALKVLDPESEKYAKELEYDVQEQISKPGYRGGVYEAADLDDTLKIIESQKSEATKLREKYPGISEALLDKIVKDSNPQRRAEVLAALDETLTMMDKGMDKDQILGILKSTTRTKNKDGGRIGFSVGGIDKVRRALLKMFGGAAATGVAAKTGMFGLLKGNKAKEAAKVANVVKKDAPPAYIFDLAKIIRAKGKDITKEAQTIERETVKTYKGMDLYESPDGSFRIQADIPTKFSEQGRQVEIMYAKTDEVVDAGMETQKTVKGEIYEEATVSPDIDGKMKDVDMYIDDRDHAVLKEFVEEEKKKFKSGGIAYMLGE